MRTYLMALGVDVWDVVETGYTNPVVLASKDDKLDFIFNSKGMNAILNRLADVEFVKVIHLETTKAMWDKLTSNYCWLWSLIIFLMQRSFAFSHVYTP
jgi:hypothetical protein